ncbi:hypothetical protein OROMI_012748 [Orobanche minor]
MDMFSAHSILLFCASSFVYTMISLMHKVKFLVNNFAWEQELAGAYEDGQRRVIPKSYWFHGDALNLGADKIENLIGFKCQMCLNKTPPICPHHCPAESSKPEIFSENNAKIECTEEGPHCLANPDNELAHQKSHFNDESADTLSDVNMEKQLQGFVCELDLNDEDLEMPKKIFLGNDPIELGGKKGDVSSPLETESTVENSYMVREAERQTIMHDLLENGTSNNEQSACFDKLKLSSQTIFWCQVMCCMRRVT